MPAARHAPDAASMRRARDSVASPIISAPTSSFPRRARRITFAGLCSALVVACLLMPAAAVAKQRTFTMRYGPVTLGGYQTAYPERWVTTPKHAGYITRMTARVVDGHGRRMALSHVMLHHVVFVNAGRPGGPRKLSSCEGRPGEPFYGTGEEHQSLLLPPGYGYRVERRDRWRMIAMLMSHHLEQTRVWLEYRVTMETSKRLTPVRPLWLRANGCDPTSSYTVPGGGAPGSNDVRSADWTMPISGRIVAAGAHLHGSAKRLSITQPRCGGRTLIDHRPRWGNPDDPVYKVRPLLHEPGPIATGYFLSRRGIPIRRGEALNVRAVYDGEIAHPAVMAITHVYVARDDAASSTCGPLPADRKIYWSRKHGRESVAPMQLPLTGLDERGRPRQIARAAGPSVVAGATATVDLTRSLFDPPNLSIALGGEVTWRALDSERHVVFLANGPRAVDSPLMRRGASYTQRFDVPGTYNLFCYLHPVTMHQTLVVRPE
jgi:plastocyanin